MTIDHPEVLVAVEVLKLPSCPLVSLSNMYIS
jgi:hypothetical protein